MKHALIILFSLFTLTLQSQTYYVDSDGEGNNGNSGETPALAWADLSYAATQSIYGDTIFMLADTHSITSGIDIPVGVNIDAYIDSTRIYVDIDAPYSWAINYYSETINTKGYQFIRNLRFFSDGYDPLSDYEDIQGAIKVTQRGGVDIYNCYFEHFDDNAITLDGKNETGVIEPTEHAAGNGISNCTFIDCCKRQDGDWMSGSIQIGTQDSIEIYGCYFDERIKAGRSGDSLAGYPIKYYDEGYNKGLKIYDNEIYKPPSTTWFNDWNFCIELWRYRGGVEIYNNHLEGSIDVDHVEKGNYDYGLKIHDNFFGYESLPTTSGSWVNYNAAIYIEYACEDIEMYNNYAKNLESFIRFSPRQDDYLKDISLHHNVFHSNGNDDDDSGCNIINYSSDGDSFLVRNLDIDNNTFYTNVGDAGYANLMNDPSGNFRDVSMRNNIFVGWDYYPMQIDAGTVDSLYEQNNIYYNNGTNASNITITPTNYTLSGIITTDPLFDNTPDSLFVDFNSDAVDGGLDLGYTSDFRGTAIPSGSAPDIGAYEYYVAPIPIVSGSKQCKVNSSGKVSVNSSGKIQ